MAADSGKAGQTEAKGVIQNLGIAEVPISDWEKGLLINADRESNP